MVFLLANGTHERFDLPVFLFHHFVSSCAFRPGHKCFNTHSVLLCQEVCVEPPHFRRYPVQYDLWALCVFVVVAPSSNFGVHRQHGVSFWDVVITGYSEEFPSYLSLFFFWYGENGFNLYASISQRTMDVRAKEGYGFIPVSHSGLFSTEFSSSTCSLIFDAVFDVSGVFFCAIDEYDKVVGVPDISSLGLMRSIVVGSMSSFPFQL